MRSFPIYGTGAFTIFSRLLGWSVFMVHFCRRYAVFHNKVLKATGFLSSMQGASTKSEGDFRSTKPAKKKIERDFTSGRICPRRGLSTWNMFVLKHVRYPIQTLEFASKKSPTLAMHLKPPFNFKGFPLRNHGKTQLAGKDLLAKTTGPLILDRPMIPPKLRVPKTRNFSPGRRKIGAVGLEVRKSLVGKTGKSPHLQTKNMKIWHLLICPGTNS